MQVAARGAVVDNLPNQTRLGIHDRVGVKFCAAQVDEPQDGAGQIRAAEIALNGDRGSQVCETQVRPVQVGLADVRQTQVCPLQIAARGSLTDDFPNCPPLAVDQRMLVQPGGVQRSEPKVRAAQNGESEIGFAEPRGKQSGRIQVGKTDIRALRLGKT